MGLLLALTIFLTAYFVLLDPQQVLAPGSGLWSALCGAAAVASACAPGPLEVEGFDLRRSLVDGANAVGWSVYAFYLVRPYLFKRPTFSKTTKYTLMAYGAWAGYGAVFLFLPSGLLVLALTRGLQSSATGVVTRTLKRVGSPRWDLVIDAELEALSLPDSFFVPHEVEDWTSQHEGPPDEPAPEPMHQPVAEARAATMKLVAMAKRALRNPSLEGDVQFTQRISLLQTSPRGGDIRLVIQPGPEGIEMVFLGEDQATFEALEQVLPEIWVEARHELSIQVAGIKVSDVLLDGSKIPVDEA